VCAVAVAYKNPAELKRLLESITAQSRPVDGIIVVDNSESARLIGENRAVFDIAGAGVSRREFVPLDTNLGSAGGYKLGMELAYAKNFNWVWLLDQDGTAEARCLELLLETPGDAGVLCPRVVSIEDGTTDLLFRGNISSLGGFFPILAAPGVKKYTITMFSTHGVMISREAMGETGYFDDRNFFCGWEDHDYSMRLKKNRIKMLLITDAVVYHPDLFVKYKKTAPGHLHWTSRLYISVGALLPLPFFLGVADKNDEETELGAIRKKTRVSLVKKHVRGFKFFFALIFSFFCLVIMKIAGKPLQFFDTLKMYWAMIDD
jgi:GT2 family glycosyltransferase